MATTEKTSENDTSRIAPHQAARPMKVVVDDDGCNWLCDSNIDESSDLAQQGCWRCSDMAFTRDS